MILLPPNAHISLFGSGNEDHEPLLTMVALRFLSFGFYRVSIAIGGYKSIAFFLNYITNLSIA